MGQPQEVMEQYRLCDGGDVLRYRLGPGAEIISQVERKLRDIKLVMRYGEGCAVGY